MPFMDAFRSFKCHLNEFLLIKGTLQIIPSNGKIPILVDFSLFIKCSKKSKKMQCKMKGHLYELLTMVSKSKEIRMF